MRKKEMIVTSSSSKLALEKLRLEFAAYRKKRGVTFWKWIKKPETLESRGVWRAYGRIEFVVGKKAGLG